MPRVDFDPAELGSAVYPLLNSVVVPRPIAWVCTTSGEGVDNAAPHSFFTVSCVQPPVLQFTSVGEKDSLRNARATGEFVICIATRAMAERVNWTSTNFPPDASEFDAAGLTREPSLMVRPPRIAESPVALECRLAGERSFGDSTVVFGEVLHLAIDDSVLRDGKVAPDLLAPVARLGGPWWSTLGEIFGLHRLPYESWQAGERDARIQQAPPGTTPAG